MKKRIAMTGASGTGKTTLAKFISEEFKLPMNPIGSRTIAKGMGFDSPYDVDKAGKRAEFQRTLFLLKTEWELEHQRFVTDRTVLDNLAYTMLHDIHSITRADLDLYREAAKRYDLVIYLPVEAFCHLGSDQARVNDATYQQLYDGVLRSLCAKYVSINASWREISSPDIDVRKGLVRRFIEEA